MTARRLAPLFAGIVTALCTASVAWGSATGAISGTVIAGQEPVCVLALGPSGDEIASGVTDSVGDYTLGEVPVGSWTVEFDPDDGCLGFDTGYAFQFFSGASTPASATPVAVLEGRTTTGVDATLAAGATIGGSVTAAGGAALPGVCVILEDTAGRAVVRQPTDTVGNYQLDQLPPGRFIVQFVDDYCAGEPAAYASTYFPNASTPEQAQVITVAPGTIMGPINAQLAPLPTPLGGGSGNAPAGAGVSGPSANQGRKVGASIGAGAGGAQPGGGPVVALLQSAGGRWTIDRLGRLHLRLSCTHADSCAVEVIVRQPRRAKGRLRGGRLLGKRRLTVRARAAVAVTIPLRGSRSSERVWIALRIGGGAPLISVIPVLRAR